MSVNLQRAIAELACRLLHAALPASMQHWGLAILQETRAINSDGAALRFAVGSLIGILPRALVECVLHPFSHAQARASTLWDARLAGIICAVCATSLGLFYLTLAGASGSILAVNGTAVLIGLVALAMIGNVSLHHSRWLSSSALAMSAMLLATAILGREVEGISRWANLGGLTVQPSLIFLPIMTVAFAKDRNALTSAALAIAAVSLALQPDRAMNCILLIALSALAISRLERHVLFATVVSAFSTLAAFLQPDTLPAVPFVDQVLYTSFDAHFLAGVAVLLGSILLVVPAVVGLARADQSRDAYLALGVVWLGATIAAALWNYPTPVVGYGGSAILGYLLSLAVLPPSRVAQPSATKGDLGCMPDDPSELRFAAA